MKRSAQKNPARSAVKKQQRPLAAPKRHFTSKAKRVTQQQKRKFTVDAAATGATLTAAPPVVVKKDGKIDINIVEDLFRSHRLAGLSSKYHSMTQAFDIIRAEGGLTPQIEEDLSRVLDVTSLKTADAAELRRAKVRALVNHYQRRPGDTGSPEVQAVLLTEKINTLEFHMTRHPQDHQLTREVQILKDRRRKTLRYLKSARFRTYQVICRDLNIEEHTFDIVGKLPRTIPYYDPTRPKYGKPLTEEERKLLSQQQMIEKQVAAQQAIEDKKKAIKDAISERRRQANMIDV